MKTPPPGSKPIEVHENPDHEGLREVNARFYRALAAADAEAMEGVWAPEDPTTCVHPGTRLFAGTETILETWRLLFEEFSRLEVEATEMSVASSGEMGFIVAIERYIDIEMREAPEDEGDEEVEEAVAEAAAAGSQGGEETDDATAAAGDEAQEEEEDEDDEDEEAEDEDDEEEGERLLAVTHAFRYDGNEWRLVHRHASTFTDDGDFFLALKTLRDSTN